MTGTKTGGSAIFVAAHSVGNSNIFSKLGIWGTPSCGVNKSVTWLVGARVVGYSGSVRSRRKFFVFRIVDSLLNWTSLFSKFKT